MRTGGKLQCTTHNKMHPVQKPISATDTASPQTENMENRISKGTKTSTVIHPAEDHRCRAKSSLKQPTTKEKPLPHSPKRGNQKRGKLLGETSMKRRESHRYQLLNPTHIKMLIISEWNRQRGDNICTPLQRNITSCRL